MKHYTAYTCGLGVPISFREDQRRQTPVTSSQSPYQLSPNSKLNSGAVSHRLSSGLSLQQVPCERNNSFTPVCKNSYSQYSAAVDTSILKNRQIHTSLSPPVQSNLIIPENGEISYRSEINFL